MAGVKLPTVLLHQQVARWMIRQIEEGVWQPHSQIPSEWQLVEELHVSRGTLQRAIALLVDDRKLYRIRGKGTYASGPVLEEPLAQSLLSLSEALDLQGQQVTTQVVRSRVLETAPAWVQTDLHIDSEESVLYLQRVKQTADGTIALLDNYVTLNLFPGIQRVNFCTRRLFDVIERDHNLTILWGSRTIDVALATDAIARVLHVERKAPLLYLSQVTYVTGNIPVECSRVWIRPDRMRLKSIVARDHPR